MVANLFLAEWRKLTGNHMLAAFTVWVYPVGAFAMMAIMMLILGITDAGTPFQTTQWPEAALSAWAGLLRFPGNVLMRLPIIAFLAIAFAGEYEWDTWKNLVPRQRRAALIGTKVVTLGVIICLSLTLTMLIWLAGRALIAGIHDMPFGPAISGESITDFLQHFGVELALAFADVVFLAALTALSVLLTRSIIGGLLLGFGLSVVDSLAGLLFPLFTFLFKNADLVNGYAYTPAHAIDNIRAWVLDGQAVAGIVTTDPSLLFSVVILALWVVLPVALAIWLFGRQDLVA